MKNKKQKGITLIALVITIIVLLILAGVAINLAIDSNGIFSKANEAVTKWNAAVAEEDRIMQNILEQMNEINGETVEQGSISLNKTTLSLEIVDGVNANETLVATKENIEGTVTWTSSVPSVATVDSNGKVTTVGEGQTTITASCGGYSATCTVTVTTRTTVKIISFTITLDGGTKLQFNAVEGWDFATWVADPNYNTIGMYITEGGTLKTNGGSGIQYIGYLELKADTKITDGADYFLYANDELGDGNIEEM